MYFSFLAGPQILFFIHSVHSPSLGSAKYVWEKQHYLVFKKITTQTGSIYLREWKYINSKELCNLNSIKDISNSRNRIIEFKKVGFNCFFYVMSENSNFLYLQLAFLVLKKVRKKYIGTNLKKNKKISSGLNLTSTSSHCATSYG